MNRPRPIPALATGLALLLCLTFTLPALAAWTMVWSDEFSGATLNTANWSYAVGNGCPDLCGWGNNELEYYRSQNVTVSDGYLVITTKAENYGGANFTSGRIHSRGKQSFLYGRVEMRAKLPTGGGMWPAFWMMPQDDVYGGWASSGELDIMESSNGTTTVGGALHYGGTYPSNTSTSGSYSLGGDNFADQFHIYAVEWEEGEIRWYVDDALFMTRTSSQWWSAGAPSNPEAPFDQEFYLLLNTAVGGWYTGCTDASCVTADLPQQYLVDYVRVYEDIDNFPPEVTVISPAAGSTVPAGNVVFEIQASDSDGTVMGVEFYHDGTYLGVDTSYPYGFVWTDVADGCYQVTVVATDNRGTTGQTTVDLTVGLGCGQLPYADQAFALPGRLEAEDFDLGGEGVALHDLDATNQGGEYRLDEGVDIEACSDADGGYNVGWIRTGEWVEYTVDVPTAGRYFVDVRVAAQDADKSFQLLFNGEDKSGVLTVPHTGAWQTWDQVTGELNLEAGVQTMRLVPLADDFNLNYFEFRADPLSDAPPAQAAGSRLLPCYPNPFNPSTTVAFEVAEPQTVSLTIFDMSGRLVRRLLTDEDSLPGRHEVVWNGRDEAGRSVATGTYLYRLQAGDFSQSRRMVLLK